MSTGSAGILCWLRQELERVSQRAGAADMTPSTELLDIDIDSLETLALLGRIEKRYGSALPASALPRLVTVADLIDAIKELPR